MRLPILTERERYEINSAPLPSRASRTARHGMG